MPDHPTPSQEIPRVLFLTSNASLADGISRHILNLCKGFAHFPRPIAIGVCITHGRGDLSVELENTGAQVFHLNAPHGHALRILSRFKAVVREFHPTVIHSHIMSLFVHIALSANFRDIPIIRTIHGIPDPPEPIRNPLRRLASNCVRAFSHFLTNVCFPIHVKHYIYISTLAKTIREVPGVPGEVLFNPLMLPAHDCKEVLRQRPATREHIVKLLRDQYHFDIQPQDKIVGFVGRIDTVKDVPGFLEVCTQIHAQSPHAKFIVVGSGPYDCLRLCPLSHRLGNSILWTGYRLDAMKFIQAFDLLLMTSFREGGPIVVLEAFASGTLVCAFDCPGGMQDIAALAGQYPEGVGRIISHHDYSEMARQALDLLQQDDSRLHAIRENAYRLLAENYADHIICGRLHDLYQELSQRQS